MCNVSNGFGYGCGNCGLPAFEGVAFTGGFAIECGSCRVFCKVGINLICKDFLAINAVSIGYGVGGRCSRSLEVCGVGSAKLNAGGVFDNKFRIVNLGAVSGRISGHSPFGELMSAGSVDGFKGYRLLLRSGSAVISRTFGKSGFFDAISPNFNSYVAGIASAGANRSFDSDGFAFIKAAGSVRLCRFFDRCGNFAAFDYVFKRVHVKGQSHGRGDVGHHHKNRKKNT